MDLISFHLCGSRIISTYPNKNSSQTKPNNTFLKSNISNKQRNVFFRYIPMGKSLVELDHLHPIQTTCPSRPKQKSSRLRGARANLTQPIGLKMPHKIYVKTYGGWLLNWNISESFFCWILLKFEFYTWYKTMPIWDHLMHFQPKEGRKHTEMSTKMTDGQTAFLEVCSYGSCHFTSRGSGCGNQR